MANKIDQIIRSRRKTLQISITRNGQVIVRAPANLSQKWINQFVEKKSEWIEKNLKAIKAGGMDVRQRQFKEGETIYFLGSDFLLTISDDCPQITIRDGKLFFPKVYMKDPRAYLERWYIKEAKNYIDERLQLLSRAMGIQYKSFGITRARRRWGSCSAKNTLNFTWRLVQAEPKVIDYVIVHELCHVLVKNHSKKFWLLVEQTIPDCKVLRKWLKEHQWLMDL